MVRLTHAVALVSLVLAAATPAAALPGLSPEATAASDVCRRIAQRIEEQEGIPPGLMQAIALAESGRWFATRKRSAAWPWTVTSGRDSDALDTKAAAIETVVNLQSRGITNIDVGCVQVNLHYHGHAFASLDEALDPESNVSYGARFLRSLRIETRSWARATARYHSAHSKRGNDYRQRVYRLWAGIRREALRGRRLSGSTTPSSTVPSLEPRRSRPLGGLLSLRPPGSAPSDANPGAIGVSILRGGR